MSKFDQVQCYMATGGIPYYISMLQKGKEPGTKHRPPLLRAKRQTQVRIRPSLLFSLYQCRRLQEDCTITGKEATRVHKKRDTGTDESCRRWRSLHNSEDSGSERLHHLVYQIRLSEREVYYRLTDFYSKFYLSFIDGKKTTNPSFWQDNLLTPSLTAWRGFTFESLCIYHLPQIKQALGISGVQTESSPWKSRKEKDGAQIDLVIERADHICNICEMKFCEDDFSINASYDKNLRHKLSTFQEETRCKNALHLTLITTYGLKFNEYAGRIQKVITMDDLFRI